MHQVIIFLVVPKKWEDVWFPFENKYFN